MQCVLQEHLAFRYQDKQRRVYNDTAHILYFLGIYSSSESSRGVKVYTCPQLCVVFNLQKANIQYYNINVNYNWHGKKNVTTPGFLQYIITQDHPQASTLVIHEIKYNIIITDHKQERIVTEQVTEQFPHVSLNHCDAVQKCLFYRIEFDCVKSSI